MGSSPFSLSAGSLFTLGLASLAVAAPDYKLVEQWKGTHFLDYFNFHVGSDPTNGFVTYLDKADAQKDGLIKYTDTGSIYIGVDHKTLLSSSGPGRNSVRIGTKKFYGHSLVIADIAHMPGGACGTWPAFWSVGQNWPGDGEIDIIEGVNKQDHNEIVMHTGGTCSIQDKGMSGYVNATGCGEDLGTVGCVIEGQKGSYGTSFNQQGGGVYAMEWTTQHVKIWFFPRNSIPPSIKSGKPDVTKFGIPMALVQDGCDVATSFKAQSFVFDVTFCGDWAGGVFGQSGCPLSSSDSFQSCTDYVAHHPAAFDQTYWEINSVNVYQTGVQGMETSTSQVQDVTPTPAPETTAATTSGTTTSHETSSHAESAVPVDTSATRVSHASPTQDAVTTVHSTSSIVVEGPASNEGWHTEAPATSAESNTKAQKPATTRYVTKLVTATTTMCSLQQETAHSKPPKHMSETSATGLPAPEPATSETPATSQSPQIPGMAAEQHAMSQAETNTALTDVLELANAAGRKMTDDNFGVDAASNERTESATAKALSKVIPAPAHTPSSASTHATKKSRPVIPTPTASSAASSSAFTSPSGSYNSPVFTGAGDKLSSKISMTALAFACVFALLA